MKVEFRTAVLRNLRKLLETCKIGDTELTDRVHIGRLVFGPEMTGTFISIIEPPVDFSKFNTQPVSDAVKTDWHLLIQGFMKSSDNVELCENAYAFLANVKTVLYNTRNVRDGGNILGLGFNRKGVGQVYQQEQACSVLDLQVGSGVVRPDEIVQNCINFWLEVSLSIVENPLNPFVQLGDN